MTAAKPAGAVADERADGKGGGAGLGAELQGSRPSESYTEFARGLSATKLAPKFEDAASTVPCRGVLNIVVDDDERMRAQLAWGRRVTYPNRQVTY